MKCTKDGRKLTFTFDGLAPVEFDSEATAFNHDADAAMHGYEQKIRDNAAISRKQKDGSVITVTEQMRRDAVMEMVNHLLTADTWNMKASRSAPQNPVILAIAAKRGCTYIEAEQHLAAQFLNDMDEA